MNLHRKIFDHCPSPYHPPQISVLRQCSPKVSILKQVSLFPLMFGKERNVFLPPFLGNNDGEVLLAKEEDCGLIGLHLNLEFM